MDGRMWPLEVALWDLMGKISGQPLWMADALAGFGVSIEWDALERYRFDKGTM